MNKAGEIESLLNRINKCNLCYDFLPSGPRPVVQLSVSSKIVIIGQAPGRKVHETGIPWNDASGRTLRKWLDLDDSIFYDADKVSIVPMGFCYPGKGASGDLPPRTECAPLWHPEIFNHFKERPLILLIGQYAQRYYLGKSFKGSITETIKHYKEYLPQYFPLPHPSPRNQNWVKVNPWFLEEVVPYLQVEVKRSVFS
ncbi:MAG: uracil-DNA glycosylase family protein [Sphingobacteriaceae bacterium]